MNKVYYFFLAWAMLLAIGTVGSAQASECSAITSLPATISTPGSYCLMKAEPGSRFTVEIKSGNAITITADHVILDLNNYSIINTLTETDNSKGVYAMDKNNITIRNGAIEGFQYGIQLDTSVYGYDSIEGHIIEDVRILIGAGYGMDVKGKGIIIRNNTVIGDGVKRSKGIYGRGTGVRIINNNVENITSEAIYTSGNPVNDRSLIDNNRITNKTLVPGSVGIRVQYTSTNAAVTNNVVTNMDTGISFIAGATGTYGNNLTIGCTTPYKADEAVKDEGTNR